MRRPLLALFALPMLCLVSGCEIPAQMYWSPDGLRAAYVPSSGPMSAAAIVDPQGTILARLEPSPGGFAWSGDSKKLYFASVTPRPQNAVPTPVQLGWANIAPDQPIPATQPQQDADNFVAVNCWEAGRTTPLFNIPRGVPYYMVLSPDQDYLALVVNEEKWSALYVYCLPARKLFLLSYQCARTACFTGPHRLAFVEPVDMKQDQPNDIGQLVEVVLGNQDAKPERLRLLITFTKFTPWLQPLGDDILMTTFPFTFPGLLPEAVEPSTFNLYRYTRADNSIRTLAESVGQYFMPAPGGRLVLFEKIANHPDPASRGSDLAVLDLSASAVHIVADAKVAVPDAGGAMHSGMPAFPAWRGDSEISFVSPVEANKPPIQKDDRIYFGLSLYRLTPQFKLEAIRSLSEKWPLDMKPSIKAGQ